MNARIYTDANGIHIVDRRKRIAGIEIIPANGEVEVVDQDFRVLIDFGTNEWTLAKKISPDSTVVLGYARHVQRHSGWDEDTDFHVEFLTWLIPETDFEDPEPDTEPFESVELVSLMNLEYIIQ
jgi:hypothetical protein